MHNFNASLFFIFAAQNKTMDISLISYLSGFVTKERLELFNKVLSQRTNYLTIVLEDIYQTQNASAVIRSADCFGIQNIHIIENKNKFSLNPDVVRGASNWVTVNKYNLATNNTKEAIIKLREQGYRIVAASPHKSDINLENFDLDKGKAAFIFGTERPGLSDIATNMADEFMKIPMVGFTESLNVSVSVAVTLHYLTDKLRNSNNVDWQLNQVQKEKLLLNWLRNSIKRVDLIEEDFHNSIKK